MGKLVRVVNKRVEMICGNFLDGFPDGECVKVLVENSGAEEENYVFQGEIRKGVKSGSGVVTSKCINDAQQDHDFKIQADIRDNQFTQECKITVDQHPFMKLSGARVKINFQNGDKYNGLVKRQQGALSGKAKIIFDGKGQVYGGQVENGMFEGHGKLVFESGEVYEGQFVENQRDGVGKFTLPNQQGYWEGQFKSDFELKSNFSSRI